MSFREHAPTVNDCQVWGCESPPTMADRGLNYCATHGSETMPRCAIGWIDAQGQTTHDRNPAVGVAWCIGTLGPPSLICAVHLARLRRESLAMANWRFLPFVPNPMAPDSLAPVPEIGGRSHGPRDPYATVELGPLWPADGPKGRGPQWGHRPPSPDYDDALEAERGAGEDVGSRSEVEWESRR